MNNRTSWTSLRHLIGDLPVNQFFANYWELRYLFLPKAEAHSSEDFARSLLSFEQADQILSVTGPRFRDFIRMSKGGEPIPRTEFSAVRHDGLVDYDIEQVLKLYEEGATITLNRAHQSSAELAQLCGDLSGELVAHVNANVYITPPYSQGFSVHGDTHDVFLIQVEGRKKWKIQKELEYLSTPKYRNIPSGPLASDTCDEIVLDPGDIIYIPRGLLHEGTADNSHSMHITLGIHPYTWADVIRDALEELEGSDTLLRQSAMIPFTNFEDTFRSVASKMSKHLSQEATMRRLLKLQEEKYVVGSYRGQFLELTNPMRLTLETKVMVRDRVDIQLELNADDVLLRFATKTLAFPRYVKEHIEMILKANQITGHDLPTNLDDDGKLVLLQRLRAEGVIQICK